VDLRLVLSLNFSDLILQLFDLIVADCLRRGRHRQSRTCQACDQPADHPLSGDISLNSHSLPREMNVAGETLTRHYDIVMKRVNDYHKCCRIASPRLCRSSDAENDCIFTQLCQGVRATREECR
jgi:hypothetical protein